MSDIYNMRYPGANINLIAIGYGPNGETYLFNEPLRPAEMALPGLVDVLELVSFDGSFRVVDTFDRDVMSEYDGEVVPIDNSWMDAMIA